MANVISVSALNKYVKTVLENDPVLTDVAVRGEIQNFTHHLRSGHFYFSLKDETGSVKAIMFRSYASRLSFVPENGMSVIVRGRITLYERDGAFQIYVDSLFPDGIGAQQIAFEQLKRKLDAEGLFAPEHKKPLPAFPQKIGLVTSRTGAAIRDIYAVACRQWPLADFLLYDAGVQGMQAEQALVQGVKTLDKSGLVDVIIVARGGGSRDDLWVFNSEALARAVFACKTPVVSGVGHEIDFTILDFVADLRAATPTAAAEQVLPDRARVEARLQKAAELAEFSVSHKYKLCYNKYHALLCNPALAQPERMVSAYERLLDELSSRLKEGIEARLEARRTRLSHAAGLLESLSPISTLSRGYCVATGPDGVVRSAAQLPVGSELRLDFADTYADCRVLAAGKKKEVTLEKD